MRKTRNITVAVSPDLYRQTRRLAAEYDTTVTALVACLLQAMPDALKRARFPAGGPKRAPKVSSASPLPASTQPGEPSEIKYPPPPSNPNSILYASK